jgi:hypothetical protein
LIGNIYIGLAGNFDNTEHVILFNLVTLSTPYIISPTIPKRLSRVTSCFNTIYIYIIYNDYVLYRFVYECEDCRAGLSLSSLCLLYDDDNHDDDGWAGILQSPITVNDFFRLFRNILLCSTRRRRNEINLYRHPLKSP